MKNRLILSRSYYPLNREVYDWCNKNLSKFDLDLLFGSTTITVFNEEDERVLQEFGDRIAVEMLKEYHGKNAKPL